MNGKKVMANAITTITNEVYAMRGSFNAVDYPPARIVHDIFTLSQEFLAVGLDSTFSASTNLEGYSIASVSIFDSERPVFFRLALYEYDDTKELNELYDALFEFLRENKPDPQVEF